MRLVSLVTDVHDYPMVPCGLASANHQPYKHINTTILPILKRFYTINPMVNTNKHPLTTI